MNKKCSETEQANLPVIWMHFMDGPSIRYSRRDAPGIIRPISKTTFTCSTTPRERARDIKDKETGQTFGATLTCSDIYRYHQANHPLPICSLSLLIFWSNVSPTYRTAHRTRILCDRPMHDLHFPLPEQDTCLPLSLHPPASS